MKRDTIFGYEWSDIQRAQQGGRLNRTIDTSKPVSHAATDADIALLQKHGADGLRQMGYMGTIDRLVRAGLMEESK